MYTKQEIILRSYREGKSQREISRELSISRKTVAKYIKDYESSLVGCDDPSAGLRSYLSSTPSYTSTGRSKICLTREVQALIDTFIARNTKNRSLGLRKQVLKKIDIFNALQSQGIAIGYTTVCNYIRSKEVKVSSSEAFIHQSYAPGSSCEFDWGEVKLHIHGRLQRFQLAVFTSSYSNYRYALLYNRQDTLAFMESHVSFFKYTGGIFSEMVYDNMRVAVSKFVGKYQKEPTQALLDLRAHYHFTHRFCNARKGNEKGHVERSVEYIRRKAFSLNHDFDSMEQAQSHLLSTIEVINGTKQQLTGQSANEMFALEKEHVLPAPDALQCAETTDLRVDKYATICWRTNRYSVPDHLVGNFVEAKLFSTKIEVYHSGVLVGKHQRNYGKHQWVMDIEHYLRTLKKKPGALSGSTALANSGYLKELYELFFKDTPRDFIELLDYCKKTQVNHQRLENIVNRLLKGNSGDITLEKIKALLGNTTRQTPTKEIITDQTTHLAKQHLTQLACLMN